MGSELLEVNECLVRAFLHVCLFQSVRFTHYLNDAIRLDVSSK